MTVILTLSDPEPFDFAQDRLVEGESKGKDLPFKRVVKGDSSVAALPQNDIAGGRVT